MTSSRSIMWIEMIVLSFVSFGLSASSENTAIEQLTQVTSLLRVVHARSLEQKAHLQRLENVLKEMSMSGKSDHGVQQPIANIQSNVDTMLSRIINVENLLLRIESQIARRPDQAVLENSGVTAELQNYMKNFTHILQHLQAISQERCSPMTDTGTKAAFPSLNNLENKLETTIRSMVANQQTLTHNLLIAFNNSLSHQIREIFDTQFNRRLTRTEHNMYSKMQNLETRIQSLCSRESPAPLYYPHSVPNSQSPLEFTASNPLHYPGLPVSRKYNPSGIDIISPPVSVESVEVGRKLKPSASYDRSYLKNRPSHCAAIYDLGFRKNGIYEGHVERYSQPIPLYCDMETNGGGWTVVLRRDNAFRPHTNFDRVWSAYKNGFGDLNGEFWLGNRYLHSLTSTENVLVRIEIVNHLGQRTYAEYEGLYVHNEHKKYLLYTGRYMGGTAADEFSSHNGSYFSTPEEDNDRHPGRNCAETFFGGWWFDNCFRVFLNGQHVLPLNSRAIQGVYWGFRFPGNQRLKAAEMKVRPADFIGH